MACGKGGLDFGSWEELDGAPVGGSHLSEPEGTYVPGHGSDRDSPPKFLRRQVKRHLVMEFDETSPQSSSGPQFHPISFALEDNGCKSAASTGKQSPMLIFWKIDEAN